MGITLSTNSQGLNNINAYITQKVEHDNLKILSGIFANVNLDGAPLIRGVFGEIENSCISLGLTYAHVGVDGINLQKNLRLNIYKDEKEAMDLNFFHHETKLGVNFKFARYGGNLSWSCLKGHTMSFGISHTALFNTTAMEAAFKINLWKSENGSSSLDVGTNMAHFVRGPLEGHQDLMVTLAFSYSL
ncbi:attacin-A-like [Musca autumnalis]|uniref:attacin-A-like n=1 Tax=Musca autumnalis TaxID=221902 RepID=UPI003CF8E909